MNRIKRPFEAYKGDEPYLFVCYAHDDADVIYPELGELVANGARVWYDEGIEPSSEWSDSLASAIERCNLFLYYLSPSSAGSAHCRREIGLALDLGLRIVVVALEPTGLQGGLRLSLGNLQSIMRYELPHRSYLEKLQLAMRQALDPAASATVAGDQPTFTERRPVTVIDTDVMDLSPEPTDPEDWLEVVESFQSLVREEVSRLEGRVAQLGGDGAVGYFGHPVAHENDAERAVRCGLALVEARARRLNLPAGVEVGIRIAINSGTAVFQHPETAGETPQATGATPGIAARLKELNQINEVLISEATLRQLGRKFECASLGEHTFTGIVGAVAAHKVSGSAVDGNAGRADTPAPFVGRELELAQLNAMFERALGDSSSFALLLGEPGIGKSRLIEEFRRVNRERVGRSVLLQCSPFNVSSPFHPLIVGLRRDFGLTGDAGDEVQDPAAALQAGAQRYGLTEPHQLAALSTLLGVGGNNAMIQSVATERRLMIEAAARWLMAGDRPVLIVVEDVHWLDPSCVEVLDAVIKDPEASGIVMVLTARPEFEPDVEWRGSLRSIYVERLLDQDIEKLIAELSAQPMDSRTRALAQRSDGIPLYAEALVQAPTAKQMVPNSLQELLVAQLDQLGEARTTAQVASVFGREFDRRMLMALTPAAPEVVGAHIARLVDSGLIFPTRSSESYVFKHALVQEMAYETMVRKQRQALHLQVGNLLTVEYPDLTRSEPHVAAAHFSSAGESGLAAPLWLQAGRDAFQRSAHIEAAEQFRRGLDQLPGIGDPAQRATLEISLQTHLGETLTKLKGYAAEEVVTAFERARELAVEHDRVKDMFRAVVRLQAAALLRSHVDHAGALAAELRTLASELADSRAITQADAQSGITAYAAGDYLAARDYLERAVEAGARNPGSLASAATHADAFLMNVLWDLGLPDSAIRHGEGACARVGAQDNPFNEVTVLTNLCAILLLRGEYADCIAKANEMEALATRHGFILQEGSGYSIRGAALAGSGDLAQGLEQMQRGVDLIRSAGQDIYASMTEPYLASALLASGDPDTAEVVIDRALANRIELGMRNGCCEHLRVRAEVHHARNEPEAALAVIRQALEISSRQGCLGIELRVALTFHALTDGGAEATARLRAVYGGFSEGFDTLDLRRAKALLEEPVSS